MLIIVRVSTCGWWWGSGRCLLIIVVVDAHGVGCGDGLWMLFAGGEDGDGCLPPFVSLRCVLASTVGRGWWVLAPVHVGLLHARVHCWQGMHKYL